MEYYGAVKKEENLTFCHSMDGPREYYGKGNKSVTERQIPLYVESNKQKKLAKSK